MERIFPRNRYYQDLLLTLLVPATVAAGAQAFGISAAAAQEQAAPDGTETIVVTGTRRTDRTATESSVPVDVFDAETLTSQSSGDMNEVLENLIPSFNVGRNSIRDGSAFVRSPTMRGLAPDETLILINGKRYHRSALVVLNSNSLSAASQSPDLNQIPVAAIGQIDVLRDGAAAQYGSDAIAGVINYTIKSNREGISLDGRVGQYIKGDGDLMELSGNVGLPLGSEGFINLTADYSKFNKTSRAVQRPNAVILQTLGYNVRQPVVQEWGNPAGESYHFFLNSGLPLSDQAELYAFGNYGHSDMSNGFFYRTPVDVTVPVPPGSGLSSFFGKSIPTTYLDTIVAIDPRPTSPTFGLPTTFYDKNGDVFETSDIYPNGFTPNLKGKLEDYSATGGIRGTFDFGLNYDFSASYGRNSLAYTLD